MSETQFSLDKLPFAIEEVWDEIDDGTVLTLVVGGDLGVSGYLELYVEAQANGSVDAWWKWTVNEPMQQEAYSGSERGLIKAAEELKASMEDMANFVRERDDGDDQTPSADDDGGGR